MTMGEDSGPLIINKLISMITIMCANAYLKACTLVQYSQSTRAIPVVWICRSSWSHQRCLAHACQELELSAYDLHNIIWKIIRLTNLRIYEENNKLQSCVVKQEQTVSYILIHNCDICEHIYMRDRNGKWPDGQLFISLQMFTVSCRCG